MTITVIGHPCYDVIEQPDGKETQNPGGIYFTVATLANILRSNDRILPVFGIGKADYDDFIDILKRYPNVDTSGIFKFNGQTNRVRLTYSSKEKRIECSKQIAEPIPWKKIKPFLQTDLILINMISGFDINLDTLDEIRMETRDGKTPIYLDVHCLPCGIREDFTRYYKAVETWRRWLFMLHAVQMDEAEAASITGQKLSDEQLANQILALDTKALHITRGKLGSTVFIDVHKRIKRIDYPAFEPDASTDTTGCGDVFGAAYCAYYLKLKNISTATKFANRVASLNAQLPGSQQIEKLSKFSVYDYSETEIEL
ncbi:MAG: carbohydrate kinase family protein [Ignavibacteriales bacterium]|nr:carbohydrate kinase family protein [Ignavibacteriales bacterium]